MPKIPLYNQGGPSQVPLATGQLGARADVGTFTAPAQQMVALGETVGRAGRQYAEGEIQILQNKQRFDEQKAKIDFDFKMAEKQREERTMLKDLRQEANNIFGTMLIEDQSTSVAEAEAKFKKRFAEFSDEIKGRNLTPRFEQIMLNEAESVYLSQSLGAKRKAFDTGTALATQTDNDALDLVIQDMRIFAPGTPEHDLAVKRASEIFEGAKNENRKLNYTPQSFELKVKLERANLGFQGATTTAQVDAVLQEIIGDNTIPPGKQNEARTVARNRKAQLQTEMFDATREVIMESSFDANEAKQISDGFAAGADFTVERANGEVLSFSPSSMTSGQREGIIKRADEIGKDYTKETRNNLSGEIDDAYDKGGLVGAVVIATEIANRPDVDPADAEAALLAQAQKLATDAQAAYDAGNYDQADDLVNVSQSLLNTVIDGTSLRDKTGSTGKSANSIFQAGNTIVAKGQGERVKVARIDTAVDLMQKGTFDNLGASFSEKERDAALEKVLAPLNLAEKLEVLEQNNLTYDPIKTTIEGAATEGLGATPDMNEVMAGLAAYREVKARGEGVLLNHTDEQSRTFFNAIIARESVGADTEDAIRTVSKAFNSGIDINVKYADIRSEVARITDNAVFEVFGFEITGERVDNRSYLHQKMEDLTKIYIGLGQPPRAAAKMAGEELEASHMNLRGMYIPRRSNYPQNLERLADLAAESYRQKRAESGLPLEDDDRVTIYPTNGRIDEWHVMVNGALAPGRYEGSVFTLEDLNGLAAGDAQTQKEIRIKEYQEQHNLTTEDQIQEEIFRLNREANALTGGALSKIRREKGQAGVDEAIAKRESLREEAELAREVLRELRRAERGS